VALGYIEGGGNSPQLKMVLLFFIYFIFLSMNCVGLCLKFQFSRGNSDSGLCCAACESWSMAMWFDTRTVWSEREEDHQEGTLNDEP